MFKVQSSGKLDLVFKNGDVTKSSAFRGLKGSDPKLRGQGFLSLEPPLGAYHLKFTPQQTGVEALAKNQQPQDLINSTMTDKFQYFCTLYILLAKFWNESILRAGDSASYIARCRGNGTVTMPKGTMTLNRFRNTSLTCLPPS